MQTRKEHVVDNFHGTAVEDPYRWLENDADPEVLSWIEGQRKRTEEFLQAEDVRPALKKRLTELWNYPQVFLPVQVGDWYFYQKNDGLQNQPALYRQQGLEGKAELVLDPNQWSEDGTIALSNFSVEAGARYLAYTVSAQGSDRQEIHILDLETGEHLPEVVKWCRFTNMAWYQDLGFYYSRYPKPGTVAKEDENNYNQIYWHSRGTSQEEDILVYEDPEHKELGFSPSLTYDEKFLLLHVFHGTDSRNGCYYRRLGQDASFVHLFEPGEASYRFVGNEGNIFYFFTDLDAPRGRIVAVDLDQPAKENWTEVLPEQEDVLTFVRYLDGKFVTAFMHNAYFLARVYGKKGELIKELSLPSMGTIEGFSGKQGQKELFIRFTSFLSPPVVFHYHLERGTLQPFGPNKLAFDGDEYEVSQVFYPSKDGTQVSMFLVHKKGLQLDGGNPTLLYGYGGFNIPVTPAFSAVRLLWLELGGVYAVANLRGGSEYGEKWHRAGMLENKQNVFDDFIAAAEWLIENGYTNPSKLAIEGRSNGGLLVSACMVQRPDLYGAVLCIVPVTDMLRYHKFTVGRYWIPEYGNAEENPEHFEFMYRYSPLHNVKAADYPATFVITGEGDDRVVPSHAYKFFATLQEAQRSSAPVLLRVDTKSGHGHGKPIAKIIDEQTDSTAFLLKVFGMKSQL